MMLIRPGTIAERLQQVHYLAAVDLYSVDHMSNIELGINLL
jgi:hypothetical protein